MATGSRFNLRRSGGFPTVPFLQPPRSPLSVYHELAGQVAYAAVLLLTGRWCSNKATQGSYATVSGNCVREQLVLPLRKSRFDRKMGTTPARSASSKQAGPLQQSNFISTTSGTVSRGLAPASQARGPCQWRR